jgi:hypothetical protein
LSRLPGQLKINDHAVNAALSDLAAALISNPSKYSFKIPAEYWLATAVTND